MVILHASCHRLSAGRCVLDLVGDDCAAMFACQPCLCLDWRLWLKNWPQKVHMLDTQHQWPGVSSWPGTKIQAHLFRPDIGVCKLLLCSLELRFQICSLPVCILLQPNYHHWRIDLHAWLHEPVSLPLALL